MIRTSILSRGPKLPLSLAEAKRNLDITHEDDDLLINEHIAQAVSIIESRSNLLLYPATVKITTDELSAPLSVPVCPVRSLTSVTRAGSVLGGVQGLAGSPYTVVFPAGLYAAPTGFAEITVEAGYLEGDCPRGLVGAIHSVVSVLYEKPIGYDQDRAWEAVDRVIQPYRMPA